MLSANSIALASLKQSAGAQGTISRILLSVLGGALSEDGPVLSARSVNTCCETLPDIWARCNHNILIHIDTVASLSQIFCESRLDALAHALDAADPILSYVESVTGFVLDPIEMVNIQPTEHAVFEITRINESDRILLACPEQILKLNEFEKISNHKLIDLSDSPVEYSLLLKSPIMNIDCIADLSTEDIVLLGVGLTKATVKWQGEGQTQFCVDGIYDFVSGEFADDRGNAHAVVSNDAEDVERAVSQGSTMFPVRLKMCVNGMVTQAKILSELQSGIAFYAGKLAHGSEVSIYFGEREIFDGELVKLGDNFAVSVKNRKYSPETDVSGAHVTGAVL